MAAATLGLAAVLPSAHAYSFDATFDVTTVSCDQMSPSDRSCVGVEIGKTVSQSVSVSNYVQGPPTYRIVTSFTTWNTASPNIVYAGTFQTMSLDEVAFFSALGSYYYYPVQLGFITPDTVEQAMKNGSTYAYGGSGVVNEQVVLTSFKDTTPVPEPETYAMLVAGLGFVGAIARRKAKRSACLTKIVNSGAHHV